MRRHPDHWDIDNIAQVLSATYLVRAQRNPKKIVDVIDDYPCFEIPLFVSAMCLLYTVHEGRMSNYISFTVNTVVSGTFPQMWKEV